MGVDRNVVYHHLQLIPLLRPFFVRFSQGEAKLEGLVCMKSPKKKEERRLLTNPYIGFDLTSQAESINTAGERRI